MADHLWRALAAYADKNRSAAHTPGHAAGRLVPPRLARAWGRALFAYDQTELPGLDVLSEASGPLAASQAALARHYNAAFARYLVGGSTAGILAMCLAFCRGRTVLVPRHAHQSIRHGLFLAGAESVDLPTRVDPATGAILGTDARAVTRALARRPEAEVFWHIDPSYDGARAPEALQAAREAGLVILTDGAHAAHYGYHPAYPAPPQGDCLVLSSHKTLPVLTGASLLVGRRPADQEALDRALRMVQTSSPSYLMLASLEAAYDWLTGAEARTSMDEGLARLARLRRALAPTPLQVTLYADPLRWLIRAPGLSGTALADRLARQGLDVELANRRAALLLWPLAGPDDIASAALTQVAQSLPAFTSEDRPADPPLAAPPLPERCLTWAEAVSADRERVPLQACAGRIAADTVQLTPPAVPLVLPGERFNPALVQSALDAGLPPDAPVPVIRLS